VLVWVLSRCFQRQVGEHIEAVTNEWRKKVAASKEATKKKRKQWKDQDRLVLSLEDEACRLDLSSFPCPPLESNPPE